MKYFAWRRVLMGRYWLPRVRYLICMNLISLTVHEKKSLRVSPGLEINKKIQSHFAIRYENLVAISQILVAKLPRCIVLSAV